MCISAGKLNKVTKIKITKNNEYFVYDMEIKDSI